MTPNTPLTPSETDVAEESDSKAANLAGDSVRDETFTRLATVQPSKDRRQEGRTTASEGLSCQECGVLLTGRKERFCSDRCRMKARRAKQQERVNELLAAIETAVCALRGELEGHHDEA